MPSNNWQTQNGLHTFGHFLFLVFFCPAGIHFDFQFFFETEKRRIELGV